MAALIKCAITSPESLVFEGSAQAITVPAADGELGILPRHAPLIGALGFGELRVRDENGATSRYFVSGGGFVEVLDNQVSVLAKSIESLDELDASVAEARLEEVQSRKPQSSDLAVLEAYERELRVAKRRLKLAK